MSFLVPDVRTLSPGPTDDFWYRPATRLVGAGVDVNEHTALNYAALWAATRVISETMAALPCGVIEHTGPKTTQRAKDHPWHRVIHDEPTPEQDSMSWRDMQVAQQLNAGNAYAEIAVDEFTQQRALWFIHPSRIPETNIYRNPVDPNARGYLREARPRELIYLVNNDDGSKTPLPASKMLHIPGVLSKNGVTGIGVIEAGAQSIGIALATDRHTGAFFKNGAMPEIVLTHPGDLSKEKRQVLRQEWQEIYGGVDNHYKALVLEGGMSVGTLSIDPEKAQLLGLRQFGIQEIARWYRLPPHLLADLSRSTFSNIEAENISFVVHSILPWVVRWEKALNRQLLTREEKGRFEFKFNMNGLLRGDSKSRAEFYTAMFQVGAFSPNDILELEDMNPVDNGDIRLVPLNMATLENAGKPQEPTKPSPQEEMNAKRLKRLKSMMDGLISEVEGAKPETETMRAELLEALQQREGIFNGQANTIEARLSGIESAVASMNVVQASDDKSAKFEKLARSLFESCTKRVIRKHAQAARREAKKSSDGDGNFIAWNESFAEKNRDGFIDELSPAVEACELLGITVTAEDIVDYHVSMAAGELLESSGVPRDQFLDAINSCVDSWEVTRTQDIVDKFFTSTESE